MTGWFRMTGSEILGSIDVRAKNKTLHMFDDGYDGLTGCFRKKQYQVSHLSFYYFL